VWRATITPSEETMGTSTATRRAGWIGVAFMLLVAAATAQSPPLAIARDGYFFVGGQYFESQDGRFMSGRPPVHDSVEKGAPDWFVKTSPPFCLMSAVMAF
jgi:hypothetical protein